MKPGRRFFTLIRERIISFTMVFFVGFLLLVSVFISAALAAISSSMRNLLPWPAFRIADR